RQLVVDLKPVRQSVELAKRHGQRVIGFGLDDNVPIGEAALFLGSANEFGEASLLFDRCAVESGRLLGRRGPRKADHCGCRKQGSTKDVFHRTSQNVCSACSVTQCRSSSFNSIHYPRLSRFSATKTMTSSGRIVTMTGSPARNPQGGWIAPISIPSMEIAYSS